MNNEDFQSLLQRADRILQNCSNEEQRIIAANYLNRLQSYLRKNHKRLKKTLQNPETIFQEIEHLQEKCDLLRASQVLW